MAGLLSANPTVSKSMITADLRPLPHFVRGMPLPG